MNGTVNPTIYMITAKIVKGEARSFIHLQDCTGKCGSSIPKGTHGRPIASAHPVEVDAAEFAPCTN